MDAEDRVLAPDEENFIRLMSNSQCRRMDDQRCSLNPAQHSAGPTDKGKEDFFHTLAQAQGHRLDDQRLSLASLPGFNHKEPQSRNFHGSTPQISVTECTPDTNRKVLLAATAQQGVEDSHRTPIQKESPEEQQKLINMISHGQRGRMEDQCCALPPATPKHARNADPDTSKKDSDEFFSLLANTQSNRLDDQRVTLPSLPGIQSEKPTSASGGDSGYLCYMVSKVQGSRMDDQRCSLPQILRPDAGGQSGSGPPRSASFSPGSEIERVKSKKSKTNELSSADQDNFLSLMHHSQRGRMEEQRCALKSPQSSPKRDENKPTQSSKPTGPDSEKFFNLLANSQGRRLDDQRVSLPTLPGIQNGGVRTATADMDASYLYYMVSKAQGSRIDEQRCSAPQILQNLGSPTAQRKSRPTAAETNSLTCSPDDRRAVSLDRAKAGQPPQEASQAEQEQFLKMMRHAQKGRMDEQRCSLQPSRSTPVSPTHSGGALNKGPTGAEADAFFNIIASSQGRRLDNQRVALPVLPGLCGNTDRQKSASTTNVRVQAAAPHITLTQGTPSTTRKAKENSPKLLPKSASFSHSESWNQNSAAQVTLRVSMSFTPQPGRRNDGQPCTFPEVFLTLGAPGDKFVLPLSPVPGRPLSLNLNLIPKEDMDSCQRSPGRATPRKGRSRSPSPNPAARRRVQPAPPNLPEQGQRAASPITPDMDYFSLIERVHTSHMQMAHDGQRTKCDKRKGKGGGKKEKKNGGNRH